MKEISGIDPLNRNQLRLSLLIAGLAAVAIGLSSCASSKKRPSSSGWTAVGPPAVAGPITSAPGVSPVEQARISQQEADAFHQLRLLYNAGSYETLIKNIQAFDKKYPKSVYLSQTANLDGLAYLFLKQPKIAIRYFKRSIALTPPNQSPTFIYPIYYNLATALTDTNANAEAQQTMAKISPEVLDRENRIKFYFLRGRLYLRQALFKEAASEFLSSSRLISDLDSQSASEAKAALRATLERTLQEIKTLLVVQELYHNFEDSPLADVLLFRMGTDEIMVGNLGNGEHYIKTLISRYPQTPYYSQATDLLKNSQTSVIVEPHSIGVLLPLKGKFGKFGERALQSIQLAFNIFNSNEPDTKISLIIEDSGDEPEMGIAALNRLVTKHHVIAVLGPLLSRGTDQITKRAQELGVPLVSISRSPGVTSDFVFPAGLTLKLQAQEIARYAVDEMKLKKFAIASPKDKVGEEMTQHFWEAVEARGGTIVGNETYNPGETDFRQVVDKLSGLYYTEARQRELDEMAKKREENNIKKKSRKNEQFFSLKPIVDYEAVFLADEPKTASLIIPTFIYRDIDKMKFLGTSAWNSQELLGSGQSYSENATFVDVFNINHPSPKVKKFVDLFKSAYELDPNAMDAVAYDAAGLLGYSLWEGTWPNNRAEVRDRLSNIRGFTGVTGSISFKDGNFARSLRLMTVRKGQFIEVN